MRQVAYYSNLIRSIRWYRNRIFLFFSAVFIIWYVDCLPDELFNDSTSTVLLDRKGQLLGAHISDDEQWRFEECDSVPFKFKTCIIQFEDRNFNNHFGVSLKGIGRAIVQNFRSGKRVSGGSTLTMQLVRLMRKNPPRTYSEKALEIIMATRMEFRLSKNEILRLYSSHAPFGNNVVGLDAASWRFFGRPAHQLSWSESATLAVLPNAPGLIYPGRNHEKLLEKRNRLLKQLLSIGVLDKLSYEIAIMEPLPDRPLQLPNLAPHLLNECIQNGMKGKTTQCTLDKDVQRKANLLLENHIKGLRENKIYNGAVVITSVETGEILAYIGNAYESGREHANQVNCINAHRSSGSILKPILYTKALESGLITPKMLLLDAPSKFGGFSPTNFAGDYDGLVPADQVLSRSLNIPMVHLLNRYGAGKFHSDLRELGFTTINQPATHYGLSLILGGAEVSLFDLSNVYTRMATQLKNVSSTSIHYLNRNGFNSKNQTDSTHLNIDNSCVYSAFEAMIEVKRPDEENNWQVFSSSQKIAWKTGTSYGFRDAWAIGITPDYVVSIWIGNADGEGRPGLTGVRAAAPLLFEVFNHLPNSTYWFKKPENKMKMVSICTESGHRARQFCSNTREMQIPKTALESQGCPYHRRIHLDRTERFRVDSDCESPEFIKHKTWFVIPSFIEQYYKKHHPDFTSLPEYKPECLTGLNDHALDIVYPRNKQKIYLPVDFSETKRKVIFEATHRNSSATLFWHLDDIFIGQTTQIHQLALQPCEGMHRLTLVDENGASKTILFEILEN